MDLSLFTSFSTSLAAQEAQVAKLQQQISTGLAVQTPDQNPAAYETGALGTNLVSRLNNDNNTQAQIQVQLGSANAAYSTLSGLFDNVQSIVEQALNGTTSAANLNALAGQVKAASQQMLSLGNTVTSNGTYLFGGSRGNLAPFQANATGDIVYYGDGASAQAAIAPGETVNTIANGAVFVASRSGDGIANIAAAPSNTGTGQILSQGVVNAAQAKAFQQGGAAITVTFGSGNDYTASQGGSTIASGTLNANGDTALQLAGSEYQISGNPAAGDSFTIAPARPQSAFSLLQNIYNALANASSDPAQAAQTRQVLNQSLAGLGQYQQATLTAQAQNGVILQALTTAASSNTSQASTAQATVANAVAANTPQVLASLTQTLTSLQAAMKTFGTVQNLSLFNYL